MVVLLELPKVSIITVNYNGEKFIEEYLDSLEEIDYPKNKYEVIVVDNNSTDNSVDLIKKRAWLKLIETGKNLGYAGGNNVGVNSADGKYIVFLSPDTIADKNFLKELVSSIENNNDVGAFSAKVLYITNKNKINTVGGFWSILGVSGSIGEGESSDKFNDTVFTFYPTGCCMIIDKDTYLKLGKFDDDYFLYCEDPDLGWRLWDNGYKVALSPKSVIYHHVSASVKGLGKKVYSDLFYYYNTRNGLITIVKNSRAIDMVWMIPLYGMAWLALAFLFSVKGNFRATKSILKAFIWSIGNVPWLVKKRTASSAKRSGRAKLMMIGLFKSIKIFLTSKIEKHFK